MLYIPCFIKLFFHKQTIVSQRIVSCNGKVHLLQILDPRMQERGTIGIGWRWAKSVYVMLALLLIGNGGFMLPQNARIVPAVLRVCRSCSSIAVYLAFKSFGTPSGWTVAGIRPITPTSCSASPSSIALSAVANASCPPAEVPAVRNFPSAVFNRFEFLKAHCRAS